ncbi:hypothetical protein MKW92_034023 [Papaver armeniacum]|nr:hypothetical protein MKW92_034023 [Papaver armeniacum]
MKKQYNYIASAATTSFRGNVSSIASLYGRDNSGSATTEWISRAIAFLLQHTCSKSRKHMPPWPEISEIVARFERKGFKLVAIKLVVPSKDFAQKHYHDLKERPFLNGLCGFSVLSLCLPW